MTIVDSFRDLFTAMVPQNIAFSDGSDGMSVAPMLTFTTPDMTAGGIPIDFYTSGSPGDGHC